MRKIAVIVLACIALAIMFLFSWGNIADIPPIGIALIEGRADAQIYIFFVAILLTFVFTLINKPLLTLIAAGMALLYFVYVLGNIAWTTSTMPPNIITANDPLFAFRFLSTWFYIEVGIVLCLFLVALLDWIDPGEEEDDEEEVMAEA
jgi:Ca2+/Na+ antiporter